MADFDLSFLSQPSALLPIARHKQSLQYVVDTYPVTIIIGQTGSGKTTQLPQFLYQAGWCSENKVIAVTQVGELEFLHVPYVFDDIVASQSCRYHRRNESG